MQVWQKVKPWSAAATKSQTCLHSRPTRHRDLHGPIFPEATSSSIFLTSLLYLIMHTSPGFTLASSSSSEQERVDVDIWFARWVKRPALGFTVTRSRHFIFFLLSVSWKKCGWLLHHWRKRNQWPCWTTMTARRQWSWKNKSFLCCAANIPVPSL